MSISFNQKHRFSHGFIFELDFKITDEETRYKWFLIFKDKRYDLILKDNDDLDYDFYSFELPVINLDLRKNILTILKNGEAIYVYDLIKEKKKV